MKTIPRILVRLLALVALVTPAVLIGGSSAQAATRIFPATGGTCVGTEVLRCLELRYDDAVERYHARAEITDAAGGADASVDVYLVKAGGRETREDGEDNGVWERLESPRVDCQPGTSMIVHFSASYTWINNGTGAFANEHRYGVATFTCT